MSKIEIYEGELEELSANNEETPTVEWLVSSRSICWNVELGTPTGTIELLIYINEDAQMSVQTPREDWLRPDEFPAIYAYFKKTIGEVEKDSNGFPIAITY